MHPRYARDLLAPTCASNLENLMDGDRAALRVHGHRIFCNPRGYAPDALNPDFRPNPVMKV
ncbi:MAG: hypothetical protein KJN79_09095 [Gammaproteobacteria bacterium]|nr:hypothetical protein [Gammaproteobacteria bacterium]